MEHKAKIENAGEYTDLQEELFWAVLSEFQKLEPQINNTNLIRMENTAVHTLLIKSFDDFVLSDSINKRLLQIDGLFDKTAQVFAKVLEEALPDIFLQTIADIAEVEFLDFEEQLSPHKSLIYGRFFDIINYSQKGGIYGQDCEIGNA